MARPCVPCRLDVQGLTRPRDTKMKRSTVDCLITVALVVAFAATAIAAPAPVHAAPHKQGAGDGLHLANDELQLTLFGEGIFTLADSAGRQLLFPHGTSYVSMRVGAAVYAATAWDVTQQEPPHIVDAYTARESFTTEEGVRFIFTYTLVGPAVRFTVLAQNEDDVTHRAQARFLLDT